MIVLFVCVENTFRSVLSEAIFNAHAPKGWHAESAGVQPAEAINPTVISLLSEVGVKLGPRKPRLVSPNLVARASASCHVRLLRPLPHRGEREV